MKYYEANFTRNQVIEYDIDKETKDFIFVNDTRMAKESVSSVFKSTHEEARKALIHHWQENIEALNKRMAFVLHKKRIAEQAL